MLSQSLYRFSELPVFCNQICTLFIGSGPIQRQLVTCVLYSKVCKGKVYFFCNSVIILRIFRLKLGYVFMTCSDVVEFCSVDLEVVLVPK